MATNGVNTHLSATNGDQRRFAGLLSSIALRMLIAFIISFMIFLAFFVSSVVSR